MCSENCVVHLSVCVVMLKFFESKNSNLTCFGFIVDELSEDENVTHLFFSHLSDIYGLKGQFTQT